MDLVTAGAGLACATGALVAASIVSAFVLRGRTPPVILPLTAGYLLGPGGFDLLGGPVAGRALQIALGIGAGWVALGASSSAAATFRRPASRSALWWAAGFALVGPSCLAGALSPIVASVAGPNGLSLANLVVLVGAAIIADPSPFRSLEGRTSLPSRRIREAVRTGDAFLACALLAWPAYWAFARTLSIGEGVVVDAIIASIAVSFGIGIGLGLLGMFLLRIAASNLAVAALSLAIVVGGALLAEPLASSAVAACFLAGTIMVREEGRRETFHAVVRRLERPFMLLLLLAAGAAAPRWTGAAMPALIALVVLAGRFALGAIEDGLASAAETSATGRRFAWIVAVPGALSAAMIAESALILSGRIPATLVEDVAQQSAAEILFFATGALSPVAPFLLALGIGDLAWRRALAWRLRSAEERPAESLDSRPHEPLRRHRRHHHHRHRGGTKG